MEKVRVLLSSYNGEKYIAEQIESILDQKGVRVELLVRDDGSTDATCRIVGDYERKYPCIKFYKGRNIGVQGSFFDLLSRAGEDADYYAFADQDDFWLENKLERAVCTLDGCGDRTKPLLYAGRVIYADEALETLKPFPYRLEQGASFGNALLQNICMGCTEVFNPVLRRMAALHRPQSGILHDWWLYLTASCFGEVALDDGAYICYRQHGDNQVGMKSNWAGRWMARLAGFRQLRGRVLRQTEDFCRAYGSLGDGEAGYYAGLVLDYRKSWANRLRLARQREICCQNAVDDFVFRLLFLAGYL